MAGFTKEEIADELARREQAQRDIQTGRVDQAQRNQIANADTECLHCQLLYNSITGGANGLCNLCLYAD